MFGDGVGFGVVNLLFGGHIAGFPFRHFPGFAPLYLPVEGVEVGVGITPRGFAQGIDYQRQGDEYGYSEQEDTDVDHGADCGNLGRGASS